MPGTGTSGAVRTMPRAETQSRHGEVTICPEQKPLGLSNWMLSGQSPQLAGHCPGLGGHYLPYTNLWGYPTGQCQDNAQGWEDIICPRTGTSGAIQLDTVRAMPRALRTLSRPGRTLFARNRNLWGYPTGHCQGNAQGWEDTVQDWVGHYWLWNTNLWGYPTGHCQDNAHGWDDTICPLQQEPLGLSSWTLSGQCPGL